MQAAHDPRNKELKKKEKLATESLPQLMPDALKALSSANSRIIKDCLHLRALNDKFPAMDRSSQLAEAATSSEPPRAPSSKSLPVCKISALGIALLSHH